MAAQALITDPALLAVLRSAEQAQEQSLAILDILDDYHHRVSPDATELSLDEQLDVSRQQKILNTHVAKLRGLNRKAVLSSRATKQETTKARQEIDVLHLQLQNLYYEQRHLRGEIAACEEYDHKYRRLPMIEPADFLALHPEHASLSEHDLTIARIEDEHVERQKLEDQRQSLVKQKDALVKETTAKKEELARLDGEMEKWLAGQEAVRKMFEARESKGTEVEVKA